MHTSLSSRVTRRRRFDRPPRLAARPTRALLAEDLRLRRHFRRVVARLSSRALTHLDESQRSARHRLLVELDRYGRAGRFPRNHDFTALTPYFVDAVGTRCAVAHLVESTGERGMVERIARLHNNAFVRDLAGDAELARWAARSGLTLDELALIQPSYCYSYATNCFCRYAGSGTAVVEGTVTKGGIDSETRVDVVHGDASLATVGQTLQYGNDASPSWKEGDHVLIGIDRQYGTVGFFRLEGDHVDTCGPQLTKDHAIEAMMQPRPDDGSDNLDEGGCYDYLGTLDSEWHEEQCDSMDDSSCSVALATVSSPLIAGAFAGAFALWARRRVLARRRRLDR